MIRSLDYAAFNRIANDERVRPHLGGRGELDLTHVVSDLNNFCFLTEAKDGGYIVRKLSAGQYEAHTMAFPSARGTPMLDLMKAGFSYLFIQTDAIEITTVVPQTNQRAHRWAEIAGFRECFRRPRSFDLDGEKVDASYRVLAYQDWVLSDPHHAVVGQAFRHVLSDTSDDPACDSWWGATLLGCQAGNPMKALTLFNRWALQAGVQTANLASANPLVLAIGKVLVELEGSSVCVLRA